MRAGLRSRISGRGARTAVLALVILATACTRDPPRMTECLGNRPAAERTRDVAPPNCDPALPGMPQPQAAEAAQTPGA
ncbi:MAG: hypothetical protein ACOY4T_08600 [Pseudomonadota bacterium]|jgi:hypothetical protein|nr:hypothetical protein [Thermoleophilia bacterium]